MKRLNVLRCGDQNYWAYYWVAQEHARYSRHNVRYAKWDEVNLNGIDVIYIHGPDISNYHATGLPCEARKRGIKVIGGYSGNPEFWSPAERSTYVCADLIVAISPQTYAFCKFHYKNIPVVFMPESIDTHFFTPRPYPRDSFIVGWAGGIHKPIKRAHLLKQLDFPVVTRSQWAEPRAAKDTVTLDKMVEFYHSIDVLVQTSLSECQPRVVMEAMACGLPVIATDVGSMRMLLTPNWIVPVSPDEDVVCGINDKLHRLQYDTCIYGGIGRRNLEHIKLHWSWEQNVEIWDSMFSAIAEGPLTLSRSNELLEKATGLNLIFKQEYEKYYGTKYGKL